MIENKGNKNLKIAFKGTEEYRNALQQEALNRRMKVQGLLERAIHVYVDGVDESPRPAIAAKVERHQAELDLLRYILENGTKEQAGWITGNLKTFAEAIQAKVPVSRKRVG